MHLGGVPSQQHEGGCGQTGGWGEQEKKLKGSVMISRSSNNRNEMIDVFKGLPRERGERRERKREERREKERGEERERERRGERKTEERREKERGEERERERRGER